MRLRLLLLFIVIAVRVVGQTYVEAIDLGDSTLTMAIYHIQVDMDKHRSGVLEMFWNRTDSDNCYRAEVQVPSWIDLDPNHPTMLKTRVFRRRDGLDSLIAESTHAATAPRNVGMRLKVHRGMTTLSVGGALGKEPVVVPVDLEHPAAFGASCSDFLKGTRHTLIYSFNAKPPVYQGLTYGQIIEKIKTSNDPNVGLWQHLDRDMPAKGVRLDHKYTLGMISDGEGGYLLIDMSTPGDRLPLKGRLTPTIFEQNYNLVWYPVHGPVQDDDCYADISMEGHVLTIHIPVLKTSFRLSRVPRNKM